MAKNWGLNILIVVLALACAGVVFPAVWIVPLFWILNFEAPHRNAPFAIAHQRAVATFVENRGFGFARFNKSDLWNEISVEFEAKTYSPLSINLIGLSPEFGDRYFDEAYMPRKADLSEANHRKLDGVEAAAVSKLRNEKSALEKLRAIKYQDGVRVVAPIYARKDCLKCHQVKVGELLGAFDYVLIPYTENMGIPHL